MTNHPEDDIPPPPYSETDIYSASGDVPSPILPSHRRGSYGRGDISQSPSSTNDGEVIYTPPLTPRSSHPSNFANDVDHLSTSSAAAYFDTRPAPTLHSRPQLIHSISINVDTSPSALPYPSNLAERDVRAEDWQTFVNFLIPHYHAANNEQIIDRKLRAEGISSPNDKNNNRNNDDVRCQTSGRSHAEAQLDQIRMATEAAAQRLQVLEQTVEEWNDGFFAPRHVTIRVSTTLPTSYGDEEPHVPGAWDQTFDQTEAAGGAATDNDAAAAAGPSRFARFMPPFGVGGPFGGAGRGFGGGSPGSFRFKGVAVEGDKISIGDRFVVDRNGLRIGGIMADTNGISVNGQPMFGGSGGGPGGGGMRGFPGIGPPGGARGPHGGRFGGNPGGGIGRFGPWGFGGGGRGGGGGWARGAPWWQQDDDDAEEHELDQRRGGRGRRGRRRDRHHRHDHGPHRSRSHSTSSESSSSSSSSESSIGSLPDYHELCDSQLPVAKQHILSWLADPEQPVSKAKVKELKQKIKEARNAPPNQPNGINEPANVAFDQKAMRKEVKSLMKEWRDLKKQQSKLRRQLRRERKQVRRAEKRERRNIKREMKRTTRDQRRCRHNTASAPSAGVDQMPPSAYPRLPSVPGFPPVPGVPWGYNQPPGVPGVPPVPQGGGRSTSFPAPFGRAPPNLFGGLGLWGNNGGQFGPGGGGGHFSNVGNSSGNIAGDVPGAWPHDNADAEIKLRDNDERDNDTPHRASQEKYKEADEVEAKLVMKETELFKLHETIALNGDRKTNTSTEGQEEKGLLAAQKMEDEIEQLAKSMVRLRTEADAEYARELSEMAGDDH